MPELEQAWPYEPYGRDLACLLMIVPRKRMDAMLWQDARKSGCNRTAIPILTWPERIWQ